MQEGRARNAAFFFLCSLWAISVPLVSEGNEGTVLVTVDFGIIAENDSDLDKVMLSAITLALTDFYETNRNYSTKLKHHIRYSQRDVIDAAAQAIDLIIDEKVQAIIGPPTSTETNFVKAIGAKAQVPILSFSATDPSLTSVWTPYFFRATQSDATQTGVISALMKAYKWREAVPIYVDNEFGQGILPYLADALYEINASIPYSRAISEKATEDQIHAILSDLIPLSARVFVVHMEIELGGKIFSMAEKLGMMSEGYVWIMTDSLTYYLDSFNSSVISKMQGALGVRPYVNKNKKFREFERRWKKKLIKDHPEIENQKLDIYALCASDAAVALAISAENARVNSYGDNCLNSSGNSNDFNIPVSANGCKLQKALGNVKFNGNAGGFEFVEGQLPPPTYQIVNIIGKSYNEIGFWTPGQGKGLSKKLQIPNSNSSDDLGKITWPGDSHNIPQGWEVPCTGKKLKILVPRKAGASPFISIDKFSGYSIDVFEEVVKALPYALRFEYQFYHSVAPYSEIVQQVHSRKYDAAVGDITIVANRSTLVDFTLPYKESSVSIIEKSSYVKVTHPKIFLTPLSTQLWLTCFIYFIGIGIVVGYLERNVNEQFRGPRSQRIGNSLWFSFSTMFFAHSKDVINNLAKMVVIVWCFAVLILTQSYTASLTSLLTVKQLQPSTVTLQDLENKRVGYYNGSFVEDMLKPYKIKSVAYDEFDKLHELFENDHIDFAVDETPYLDPFIATHCGRYTATRVLPTGGFGFVFPIGSPLAEDMSRAVLKVVTSVYNSSMSGDMSRIEEKWFSPPRKCSDEDSKLTSSKLELKSFWPLFVLVWVTSVLALVLGRLFDRRIATEAEVTPRTSITEAEVTPRTSITEAETQNPMIVTPRSEADDRGNEAGDEQQFIPAAETEIDTLLRHRRNSLNQRSYTMPL